MEFLFKAILVLHFLGLASLIGGFLVQIKTKPRVVNTAMLHGIYVQLVTGILMVGLAYPLHSSTGSPLPNNVKIAIKLLVAIVVLVLLLANRKKESISDGTWAAIGGLSILNVVVAVFV